MQKNVCLDCFGNKLMSSLLKGCLGKKKPKKNKTLITRDFKVWAQLNLNLKENVWFLIVSVSVDWQKKSDVPRSQITA